MNETVADRQDVVEVVILSGPRRGQITRVDLGLQETLSDEEMQALKHAVSELEMAFQGLLVETKGLKEDLASLREVF